HFINWQQDPQSNYLARVVFPEKVKQFCVEVDLVAEMSVLNPFDFFLEPDAEKFPFSYDHAHDHELAPFRFRTSATPQFPKYLGDVRRDLLNSRSSRGNEAQTSESLHGPRAKPGESQSLLTSAATTDGRPRTIDFLVALNQKVWKDIHYLIRLEPGVQTPEE